jgi:hypothetical protein
MFTPSIYQFITSPRERPEEEKVDDNEVMFVLSIIMREDQSLFSNYCSNI